MPPDYPRRYGDYVLLENLGKGGMSVVDLARRRVDAAGYVRFLVIKRMLSQKAGDPAHVRMFVDEARINAELQHSHIAQVYDFGEQDDEWYLAMEYVPGVDLRQLQRLAAKQGDPRLPPRIALRILHDVLDGLHYAHTRLDTYGRPMRIVHRDVNPRNIMVSVRGEVKLIDFGVAKADTRHDHTMGQVIKGKFAYMAPEQIESPEPVDGRADLFALGMVFEELLTGTHPFRHLSEIQIIHRLMSGRIDPMPDAEHPDPEAVRDVRNRALATDRNLRHPDARAMQSDLLRLAAPLGGLANRAELAGYLRRLDPEAADQIALRLTAWRDKAAPAETPLSPADLADDLGRPEDTWHSDVHTSELPREPDVSAVADLRRLPATTSTDTDTDATVADPVSVSQPDPAQEPVATASPGLSPLLAITAGAGAGLIVIGVLVLIFVAPWQVPESPPEVVAPITHTPAGAPEPVQPTPAVDRSPPEPSPQPEPAAEPRDARAPSKPRAAPTPQSDPVPVPAAPVPSPKPTPAPVPEAVEPAAPEPAPPESEPEPVETGYLFVTSRPTGAEVFIDGASVGTTPLRNYVVPAGKHRVELRHPTSGDARSTTVTIEPRQAQTLTERFQ